MQTTQAKINGKNYTVESVFNMVLNYVFTDDKGIQYLVDGEDVSEWADKYDLEWTNGLDMAVLYAEENIDEDGVFWWKIKGQA